MFDRNSNKIIEYDDYETYLSYSVEYILCNIKRQSEQKKVQRREKTRYNEHFQKNK